MSLAQHRVQLLVGLVVVAIVVVGAGIIAFYALTANRQAASSAITVPVTSNVAGRLPDEAFPAQAQGFLHPAIAAVTEEPAVAILTQQQERVQALQKQGDKMLAEGSWQHALDLYKQGQAILQREQQASGNEGLPLGERQERAQALRQQGNVMLKEGRWREAHELFKRSQAVLLGQSK